MKHQRHMAFVNSESDTKRSSLVLGNVFVKKACTSSYLVQDRATAKFAKKANVKPLVEGSFRPTALDLQEMVANSNAVWERLGQGETEISWSVPD